MNRTVARMTAYITPADLAAVFLRDVLKDRPHLTARPGLLRKFVIAKIWDEPRPSVEDDYWFAVEEEARKLIRAL